MLLSIKKEKEMYSISRRTLINLEKEGLITPVRTPKGRRRYRKEDIEKLLGMIEEKPKPTVVLYCWEYLQKSRRNCDLSRILCIQFIA